MTTALAAEMPLLVQLLMERGALAEKDLGEVRQALTRQGPVDVALLDAQLATELDIAQAYADFLHLPLAGQDAPLRPDRELAERIGEKLCRDRRLVPLDRQDGAVTLALADPTDLTALEQVQMAAGLVIRPVVAPLAAIDEALAELFGKRDMVKEIASEAGAVPLAERLPAEQEPLEEVVDLDQLVPRGRDSHVIRLVNHILSSAVVAGASDIHLEPFETCVKVRMRVDGRLQELSPPPRALYIPMLSRLKVLARMDIAERRVPLDGSIALVLAGKRIDLRVSTVPTVYGEKMVLRILSRGEIPRDLTRLGFSAAQAQDFRRMAESPHGLLLVTGPTGSGKSTTLYATLNLLNQPDVNILTVEDPVEYKFEGLNQVHVRSQVGLTFASALRAFLRQDPDIIMVGEVRDQETAQICLRAALTGHLVLSTLHTNDALAAVNRLVDMGVERFLLASALRLVQAQRLVRRLCEKCKQPYRVDAETCKRWRLDPALALHRPVGCEACRGMGYRGRVGLFEVIPVTPRLRDMVAEAAPLPALRQEARRMGVMLLSEAGLNKAREGLTSLEEVLSACIEEEA